MSVSSSEPSFGYLDFLESPDLGFTGGYLIVSSTGRPLEFHCTAPVQASRAQEILFGPTLRPHLLGEQIGRTLRERATIKPTLLVISDADLADAAAGVDTPVVLSCVDSGGDSPAGWRRLVVGDRELGVREARDTNVELARTALQQLAQTIDIAEPFERIREAIREAHRLGQAREVHAEQGATAREAA